jgi:hypothetical protein
MRVSRRAVLRAVAGGGLAGAGALSLDGLVITPNRLDVSHHRLGAGGHASVGPGEAVRGAVRVAHVSDLHLRDIGAREEAVLGALADLAPDVIAITGDSLDAPAGAGPLGEFLARCPPCIPSCRGSPAARRRAGSGRGTPPTARPPPGRRGCHR